MKDLHTQTSHIQNDISVFKAKVEWAALMNFLLKPGHFGFVLFIFCQKQIG